RFFSEKDFQWVGKQIASSINIQQTDTGLYRFRETPLHYAYLKISDGCDNRCHYCTIPLIKGKYHSRPVEQLFAEAQQLANQGVKELIVVAQDTTYYGWDIGDREALKKLIQGLAKIDSIRWIRILYAHPAHFDKGLIQLFQLQPKLCHYIDLPIQHISDKILSAMGRKVSERETRALIQRLRKEIPDIAIRTTIMVGYPGENDNDFNLLKEFVTEIEFDRLGIFKFIAEHGTPAENLPDQIDEALKEDRLQELAELQLTISYNKNQQLVGKTLPVIVDQKDQKVDNYLGRSQFDSPLIDNTIHIKGDVYEGEIYDVIINRTEAYDLWGEALSRTKK
ncbi:MAG: MiaB/RimO family radical SAM methylthiotransferase, partial [bacterium]|nr:MiaB/RimO family radical SAM methylthiotransferase [bacterium]